MTKIPTKRIPPTRKKGQGLGRQVVNGLVLDFHSAAEFIGCSDKKLRAKVERRTIPFRRDGRRIIFIRGELTKFFENLDGVSVEEAFANHEARNL